MERTPLRIEREKREWTTVSVAQAVEIDQSYYSKIELGKIKPSPEIAAKIARHFGNTVTEIQILYPERFNGKAA